MSIHADEGTAAHAVLESCLQSIYEWGVPIRAADFVGTTILIVDGPHALLSPSGAGRWMTCPGSVKLSEQFPEESEGPREIEFTEEYAQAVQICLDYVEQSVKEIRAEHGPCVVRTERRVSPEKFLGTKDCDGSSDIGIIADTYVKQIDFKAGAGVPVSIDDPQNDLYLLGTIADYTFDSVPASFKSADVVIVQPRCKLIEPHIRERHIPDIAAWQEDLVARTKEAIRLAREPNAPTVPSEKACRFCSAKGACSAHMEAALQQAGVIYSPLDDLPGNELFNAMEEFSARDTRILTGEQLRTILDAREMLAGALQAAQAWAQDLLIRGAPPAEVNEAYKLVRGKSMRKWKKEKAATEKALKRIKVEDPDSQKLRVPKKTDLYVTSLRSVAAMEKMFKGYKVPPNDARWDAFRELVDKPLGALTIAPRSDPREEVVPNRVTALEAFKDMDEGDAPPVS